MTTLSQSKPSHPPSHAVKTPEHESHVDLGLAPGQPTTVDQHHLSPMASHNKYIYGHEVARDGFGHALSDTPLPSIPTSPKLPSLPHPGQTAMEFALASKPKLGVRQSSAGSTPRIRPTTLDIPGLTKSKVSPDGKIAKRDVGSKLVIVMVGLPARGKSYITKKLARYLNWLQHDARIFNVGERRRVVAHGAHESEIVNGHERTPSEQKAETARIAANIMLNSDGDANIPALNLPENASPEVSRQDSHAGMVSPVPNGPIRLPAKEEDQQEQQHDASFFDPNNKKAAAVREQVAIETLDELLHWMLEEGGSVGILDATNSTLARRKIVMDHIREKAGPAINVLFVESVCEDESLLEANMRLKLSGPDYKDKDPVASLADFKERVKKYESAYVPLGEYEEKNNMPYVKLIDVGRKVISHQIKGFLSSQAVYYLLNFNLAPRQIWITRHGESIDNQLGKIGGDAPLSENGQKYGRDLSKFITSQWEEWEIRQQDKEAHTHLPPLPGDHTPPNPHYQGEGDALSGRNFCVWTSMLQRSVETAESFDDEEFDLKQMRMLNELYAGSMEGMTYSDIKEKHAEQYNLRLQDKLAYRYPGPGGEGYLDIINRLRPVIVEMERMTDHCLLITHRSIARVLLAYFMGLRRDQVADLDCPLGMLYSLEPKPYGVEFKAYKYNMTEGNFDYLPNFELRKAVHPH